MHRIDIFRDYENAKIQRVPEYRSNHPGQTYRFDQLGEQDIDGIPIAMTRSQEGHLEATFIPDTHVNYMFSVEAINPLTALFYKLLPYEYWYMYLVLPIVAVYLLGVYTPQIRAILRQRKAKKLSAEAVV